MSDPATSSSSYGRPRHQRSSSQQYDMSYFDSDATTVDEFAYSGRRERQAMNSSDSDDAYRRYRHLSDNQSNNLHYYSNGRDKQSPSSYRLQGKPLDSDALTYGGDRPEEELYQNVVGVRRSSRDEYSRNGLNDFCGGSNVPNSLTGNGEFIFLIFRLATQLLHNHHSTLQFVFFDTLKVSDGKATALPRYQRCRN